MTDTDVRSGRRSTSIPQRREDGQASDPVWQAAEDSGLIGICVDAESNNKLTCGRPGTSSQTCARAPTSA